jgi:hypothetical protein
MYLICRFVANPVFYNTTQMFRVEMVDKWRQLKYRYEGAADMIVTDGAQGVHFVGLEVGDNDLEYLTEHNLTYKVDQPLLFNDTSFVIVPPEDSPLFALTYLNCCLLLNSVPLECHECLIGVHEL